MVLMTSPGFAFGLGLDIHIRTTRVDNVHMNYSYISGVAVRAGPDVLEVRDDGTAIINGKDIIPTNESEEDLAFSGFRVHKSVRGTSKKIFVYDLNLSSVGDDKSIQIRSNTKIGMLFVDVKGIFLDSRGILGASSGSGRPAPLLARDGVTDLTGEWNTLAEDWQVRSEEVKLFQEQRAPQHPAGCRYESSVLTKPRLRRRLMDHSDSKIIDEADLDAAERACANAASSKKSFCVDDVMATKDVELAEDPFYIM